MIIRALRLRHGRIALPRTLTPISNQRRHQSTTESSESTERAEAPIFMQESTAQAQLDAIPNLRPVKINDPNHPVARDYAFFMHQKQHTQHLGSALAPHYKPHELLSNPPSPKDITLELLLASQAHIGHATSLWHPANARYIFGVRGRKDHGEGPIHIISLEATAAHLRRACKVVSGVTERGGLVLFVGTRQGHARAVVKAATMAKGCHLFTKWIPGSITNGQQILGRAAKKVVNEFDEEVEGFEDQLITKAALKPDLVVCLNPLENYVLLHECGLNNIPTIGIIDTDANPTWVTYPIPANDDSLRTIQVIAGVLGRAGQQGQEKRLDLARSRDNIITYHATHGLEPPAAPERREKKKPQRRQQPQAASTHAYVAPLTAAADLPSDPEEAEVQQTIADQGTELSTPNYESAEAALLQSSDTQYADVEPEGAEDDIYNVSSENIEPIDESLLEENYGAADDSYTNEDLQQFGGIEQLEAADSSSEVESAEPDLQATQAPEATLTSEPSVTSSQEPPAESPIDQAGDVAEELGEEPAPPATEPETEDSTDAVKPEPPVTDDSESASPTQVKTGSEVEEEDGNEKSKSR